MNHEISSALLRTIPFLVVICVVAILSKRKKINIEDLGVRKPLSIKLYLIWIVGFLIYALLTEFSLYSINILEITKWNHSFYPSIILILGAVILAPIAEELLFRGFILNALIKKRMSIHWAILIQACFFVLLHNFSYDNNLTSNIGKAQSLVDAILFGYARVYTRSIFTPITMHISGNLIATIERFI